MVVGFAYRADVHLQTAHHCGAALNRLTHFCEARSTAQADDRRQANLVVWALYVLPALAGMDLGAPLVAAELERGTNRLAWTQGASRTRWLVARGGLALAAAIVPVVAVVAVVAVMP